MYPIKYKPPRPLHVHTYKTFNRYHCPLKIDPGKAQFQSQFQTISRIAPADFTCPTKNLLNVSDPTY